MEILRYTIPEREFKKLGYTFQKLYAREYKTYRKLITEYGYTVWCWSKGKKIEIEDWYEFTGDIVKFYKENFTKWLEENQKWPRSSNYMILLLDRKKYDLISKDMHEYYLSLSSEKKHHEYLKKYKEYNEIVLHIETFDLVIKEIEKLKPIVENARVSPRSSKPEKA